MGELVAFGQRDEKARRGRVLPARGRLGEIVLFTGVRYERQWDLAALEAEIRCGAARADSPDDTAPGAGPHTRLA